MAELSANALQLVNPGESVVFTDVPVPCERGLIRHRDGTGDILLTGVTKCRCEASAKYLVSFSANVAIPTGGTVEPISLGLAINGNTIPATAMISTPAAVDQFNNVSVTANAQIWRGCCETLSVRNLSNQPIQVQNANIVISR